MLDPDRRQRKKSEGIGANIAAAVLLTVVAIPLLLLATCVPVGFILVAVPYPEPVIGGILALATVLSAALAWHADTPGKRIGFIIAAIEIAALGVYLLFYLN